MSKKQIHIGYERGLGIIIEAGMAEQRQEGHCKPSNKSALLCSNGARH